MTQELERNMPNHENWEGSFHERLTEYGEWNADAFWLLHIDLLNIAKNAKPETLVERDLAYMLLYIQQRVLKLITAHFVKKDVFKIKNIPVAQLYEYKERFEMAIIGAVTGVVLPESSFDLVNPLVGKTNPST
jgi:Immunity protein 41